jgi:hypothetical protein
MARKAILLSLCNLLVLAILIASLPSAGLPRLPASRLTTVLSVVAFLIPPITIILGIWGLCTGDRSSYSLLAIIISLLAWYHAAFVITFYC